MKNNLILKFILFCFCLLTSDFLLQAQNLPSYLPVNGLVGWWPFNGNANDESGNGNNGIMYGVVPTSDRNGNLNRAFSFNGIDSYIKINNSSSFQFNGALSISTWVKANFLPLGAFSSTSYILSKGSDGGNPRSWCFNWDTDGIGCNVYQNDGVNNCGPRLYYSQYQYQLNTWYNVTLVFDGTNGKFYLNGELKSTIPCTISNFSNFYDITIGRKSLEGNPYIFNGIIDDVAIYNRQLSQSEVSDIFLLSDSTDNGNPIGNCPTLPTNLQQGLKGYWPFCGNASDESGNGNNGTVLGASLTTDRFGNANRAFSFNGNSRIKTPASSTSLDINQNLTISFWVKHSIDSGEPPFLWRGDSQGEFDPYSFYRSGNDFVFRRDVGTGNQIETVVFPKNLAQSDTWIQLAGVFEASTNKMSIFLNGQLMASRVVSTPIQYATAGFITQFGGVEDFPGYIGLLDDIAIWNRALSPEEITQLYEIQSCATPLAVSINGAGIQSANPGSSLQLQAQAVSAGVSYRWQAEAAEMGWNNLPENSRYQRVDSARLQISGIGVANHLQKFRVIGKSGGCADTSGTVLLQVSDTCITSISDTSFVTITDTSIITIFDTNTTIVYDTNLVTVTDTLIINTIITAGNPGISNTLKAWPNPTAGMLFINTGNFASMAGYSIRISSAAGQQVYESPVNQAMLEIPLDSFGTNGLYYLRLYKPNGDLVTTRKIVLQQ